MGKPDRTATTRALGGVNSLRKVSRRRSDGCAIVAVVAVISIAGCPVGPELSLPPEPFGNRILQSPGGQSRRRRVGHDGDEQRRGSAAGRLTSERAPAYAGRVVRDR
jgi:hypothetical protein